MAKARRFGLRFKLFNNNMVRSIFIFILFLFAFALFTSAQDRLTGRIFEAKTKISLGGIKIENLKSHFAIVADTTGRFSIKAAVGDFISFSGVSYQSDTVYVANLNYLEVRLKPRINMLDEVKVQGVEIKTGKLSAAPITGVLDSRTVLYQTDANNDNKGGIKISLFDSDGEKKKKRDGRIEQNEERQTTIFKVFQAKNLQGYLPIRGVEMDNFIILYTPDVATYFEPGFNLTSYLNASYQKFLEIPAADRQSETAFRLTLKSDTTKH
jgi:hypothetical protein